MTRWRAFAAVLGVAVLVTACADQPRHSQNDARPATVTHTAVSTGIGVTSSKESRITRSEQRLWALAVQQAGSAQDILRAEAVRSDRTTANRVLMYAGPEYEHGVVDDPPVWALQVVLRTIYVCTICRIPSGADAPRGRVVVALFDRHTFNSVDWGLSKHTFDLNRLGHVIPLHG